LICRPAGQRASYTLAVFLIIASVSLAGCEKRRLNKNETRAVTSEIIGALRRVTGHRSEITIHPGIRSLRSNPTGSRGADDVYCLISEPDRIRSLRRAFHEIADRHDYSLSDTAAGDGVRFEFAFDGTITQVVHIVIPLSARVKPAAAHGSRHPELAIILDDVGYDRAAADALLSLPFTVTLSVLPHLPLSSQVAEEAYRRGDEVMLHLPMQSEAAAEEGVELRVGMNAEQVNSALTEMLETVPHATGVNNHEGSRATADPALMEALMPALRQRGLFFIDSRTTAATVAYDTAKQSGVHAASRRVFLDDEVSASAIRAQLDLAARDALRDGSAIAIGHPHPETIAALADGVPTLESRGIRLVFASQLVH
jgi:polysaccharide deacetylase 2 family uncharacterized protein YibQ